MASQEENLNSNRVKVIEDPEKIQIMLEKTRRTILSVLGTGIKESTGEYRYSMSVTEITKQLNALNPIADKTQRYKKTAIYHHVEILKENGFLAIDEQLSGVTTYYYRSAPVFVSSAVLGGKSGDSEISDNTDVPLNENLKIRSEKMLKSFNLDDLPKERIKEFQELISNFSKRSSILNREIAQDIKYLENDDAIRLYRFIWFFWACSDSEMAKIATDIKNFLIGDL